MNDSDAEMSLLSEVVSSEPLGRLAATSYDCTPSDCAVMYTSVREGIDENLGNRHRPEGNPEVH